MPEVVPIATRVKFLNIFRNIFRLGLTEKLLAVLTNGKGYDNFFVKCIPQNYQYPKGSYRTVERRGIRYRLDLSEYMEWVIFWGLNVEDRTDLYPLISKGMVILDIGTNIGETLLNFAVLTGENGNVYGFEPVAYNFEKCNANIALNAIRNAAVYPVALSDKSETLYFEASGNFNSGGIYMQKEIAGQQTGKADAITLDEFFHTHQLSAVDFIKIDTEGFEMNVIRGGLTVIQKYKPVLFVEVDETNLKRQGSSSKELIQLIRSFGYTVQNAKEGASMEHSHYDLLARPINP